MGSDQDQILSQNEVNAILEEVSKGRLSPVSKPADKEEIISQADYETYDLASQDRIIRGRMAGLEMINDRLNRYLQISLSSSLRKVVEVTLEHTELIKFGEFINRLVAPSCFNLVKFSPLRGVSIISIESRLIFAMLSVYFGGQPDVEEKAEAFEQRDFTMVERNVIRRIVSLMLGDLQRAWHPVNPITPSYLRTETNPQFIGVVPHADVVINTYFTVEFENVFGTFNIVIPYSMIEPIKAKLSVSSHGEEVEVDHTWVSRLEEQMLKTSVGLSVELGRTTINVDDLQKLKVGDILKLDAPSSEPLVLQVENVPKMLGHPVTHKGNMALRIEKTKLPS